MRQLSFCIVITVLVLSSLLLAAEKEGCISGDCVNGKGFYKTFTDDYVGQFKDGKYDGQGTWTWNNGSKYVGEFKNGKRHGKGKMTTPFGLTYDGQWEDNEPHGQGIWKNSSGEKYVGQFKVGKRDGHGTVTYSDGSKYVGEWKDGKRHGQGIEYAPNGKIRKKGCWLIDRYIEEEGVCQ